MSGTAPREDQGPCDERACQRPYGHRGPHALRECERPECTRRTRNSEERLCLLHEDQVTYERYTNRDGSARCAPDEVNEAQG